jgi:enamine deaminase RidA (YjgF/YER057c/UK114 family)
VIRVINPPDLQRQSFYNHAVVKPGTPVFLTGQVAWDKDGAIVGVDDIAAQIAQVWRNIDAVLRDLGAGREDIVKLLTFATSRDLLPAIHAGRDAYFGQARRPASTFIVVAGLAHPDLLVEIDVSKRLLPIGPRSIHRNPPPDRQSSRPDPPARCGNAPSPRPHHRPPCA